MLLPVYGLQIWSVLIFLASTQMPSGRNHFPGMGTHSHW